MHSLASVVRQTAPKHNDLKTAPRRLWLTVHEEAVQTGPGQRVLCWRRLDVVSCRVIGQLCLRIRPPSGRRRWLPGPSSPDSVAQASPVGSRAKAEGEPSRGCRLGLPWRGCPGKGARPAQVQGGACAAGFRGPPRPGLLRLLRKPVPAGISWVLSSASHRCASGWTRGVFA